MNLEIVLLDKFNSLLLELISIETIYTSHELYSIGKIDKEQYTELLNSTRESILRRVDILLKETNMIKEADIPNASGHR